MHDLIIIGAGPAGLASAIEAQKAGLNYLLLDKGSVANAIQGFQRDMFFFSTPEMLEIGGIPFIVPTMRPASLDCVNYYRRVAEHYQLSMLFYREVTAVWRKNGNFQIKTAQNENFDAKSVIVATGYWYTPNLLGVPGEDLPHVTHYYRDPLPYFKQHVLIVGGKNSAVEAALDLWRHGAVVTMAHRGPSLSKGVKYWIQPDFDNRVAAGAIKFHTDTTVKEFRPGCTILRSHGKEWEVKTDFAFILTGYHPDVEFLKQMGIAIDPVSLEPQYDPATYETNIPNLYVAGGLVGGLNNNKIFIENGRKHGKSIIKKIIDNQ